MRCGNLPLLASFVSDLPIACWTDENPNSNHRKDAVQGQIRNVSSGSAMRTRPDPTFRPLVIYAFIITLNVNLTLTSALVCLRSLHPCPSVPRSFVVGRRGIHHLCLPFIQARVSFRSSFAGAVKLNHRQSPRKVRREAL